MRVAFEASAFVEGVGGGVVDPDGTAGAEVDLVPVPEFDLLEALSREQVEQMMLTSGWDQELSLE